MVLWCSIALQRLKYHKTSSLERLLVYYARGVVAELLSQGQMTGLCAETYSPFLSTFYFLECKGMVFL